jgi:hypothetical protein
MELLNIAGTRLREALDGLSHSAGDASFERRQVGQRGLGPLNSLHFGQSIQAQAPHRFLVRYTLVAVALKPFVRFRDR